jgi:hypothetical protein
MTVAWISLRFDLGPNAMSGVVVGRGGSLEVLILVKVESVHDHDVRTVVEELTSAIDRRCLYL